MGIGHFAVGLGMKRADPRTNVGWYCLAAAASDLLLGVFVLADLEEVHIPPSFAYRHYVEFTFPYSHGVLATVLWALVAALIARAFAPAKTAILMALAFASHFVLDWLVHVPELPLTGSESRVFGLGLWNHPPLAVSVEGGIVLAGVLWYATAVSRRRRWIMFTLMLVLTALFFAGQWFATEAPPVRAMAWTWIAGTLLLSGVLYLIDRPTVKSIASE